MIAKLFSWLSKDEARVEPLYHAREVWTYQHTDPLTKRVSTRPVLIYRKASDGMFWGLLLMKTNVNGKVLYVPRRGGKKISALAQMRTLKAARLVRKVGTAGEREFATLHNSILRLLAQSTPGPVVRARKPRILVQQPRRIERSLPSPFAPAYMLQARA